MVVYEPHRLSDDLREHLDELHVRPLIEYVAERMRCSGGHQRIGFYLEDGNLRQSEYGQERMRNEELELYARVR